MRRSLIYYRRTHLAVIAGAAIASAVLTGALLVGDSVRGSLRDLLLARLGRVEQALVAQQPFGAPLAERLAERLADPTVAPALLLRATAVHAASGARAAGISLIGVDERLAALYPEAPAPDFARRPGMLFPPLVLNESLAGELGAAEGDEIVISFERPSEIPRETVVGRRAATESLETLRLSVAGIVPDRGPGGFSLALQQTRTFNAFVELDRLQRRLFGREDAARANLLLVGGSASGGDAAGSAPPLADALAASLELGDLGLELAETPEALVLESREFVLEAGLAEAAADLVGELGGATRPVMTYLANAIRCVSERCAGRSVPYSTVAALATQSRVAGELTLVPDGRQGRRPLRGAPELAENEILLDAWTADDLGAAVGDEVELDYYRLGAHDELSTETVRLTLAGVVAMTGLAVDASLTPDFPGMQDAEDMSAWDPPFPVDLDAIRPRDEEYWDDYRSAPKAFVAESLGRRLWRSRFGELTSIRVAPPTTTAPSDFAARLRAELPRGIDPALAGLHLQPLRARGLRAAQGATDFAGLFVGLSLFLIASAALLVGLLFRLGVEQRAREIGLRRAIGYRVKAVRRMLLGEGLLLAAVGSALGLGASVLYAWVMLAGLRSWWLPAVGAPVLFLHVGSSSLAIGWVSSVAVVAATIGWTLRRLGRVATPRLLAGAVEGPSPASPSRRPLVAAIALTVVAAGLVAAAVATGKTTSPGLAFGTGAALLVAGICAYAWRCGAAPRAHANRLGSAALLGMGARNAGRNRTRSVLSVALVSSACFLIVALEAFRGGEEIDVLDHASGAGGYSLVAEVEVPLQEDLGRPEHRERLGFTPQESAELAGVGFAPFRLRPGEDVSCLNLYRPERPRILGVPAEVRERGGFTFQQLSEPVDNPWRLLESELEPGVIPAIGDYNSVLWILHLGLGKDMVVTDDNGAELHLRMVGLLAKSLFQSELLISEENFQRYFPSRAGYSYFLLEAPLDRLPEVGAVLESRLGRFGFDATPTAERLAAFQAVERTYLSTFQTLGGFGLLLGTLGLGVVLLRNVLERRGELATMRAFGYRRASLGWLVLAENAVLLGTGIAVGGGAGLVAVSPHFLTGAGQVPWALLAATLAIVFVIGMLASTVAVTGTLRMPLLESLKAE